jgi:hypothetical protein
MEIAMSNSNERKNRNVFEPLEGRLLCRGGGGSGGGGGGGGGGTPTPVLTAPAIAPGTFDGIGSGPSYIRESFGFAQGTRYKQNGDIKQVFIHDNINGIRAEFPNNKTETWIAPPETTGGQEWDFAVVGPSDPHEAYTPLQYNAVDNYYSDGTLALNGASFLDGSPDLRPNALLPFAAPTNSAYTVSGDTVGFFGKTAIGFSSSSTLNKNFETNGEAWLEVNFMGNFPAGGSTFIQKWEFHTNGLSGPSLSGTFNGDITGFNRLAVSYDPVSKMVAASINGDVVASLPYTLKSAIKYTGVEGSWYANIDNFQVNAGAIAPPATTTTTNTGALSSTSTSTSSSTTTFSDTSIASDVLQTSSGSVLA